MIRSRTTAVILSLMLSLCCVAADEPASQPTTMPTSQPDEPKLPVGAIRRLGDLRFADLGPRGGFFSTDNNRLISFGNELVVRDAASGWIISQYKATDHLMAFAAYFGDGQIAVACNATTTDKPSDIIVLDEKTGGLVRRVDRPWTGGFSEFAAAPDGSRLAVVTDHILLCDGQTGQTIRDLGAKAAPTNVVNGQFFGPRIAFSGDSKTFVAVTYDGEAHVIDPTTGQDKIGHTFDASLGANISGDGKTLATLPDDHDLHLFDLPSGDELPVPPVEIAFRPDLPAQRFMVMHLAFAKHGGMLAYTYSTTGVNLLDTSERPLKLPRRITPEGVVGTMPIISDDGSLLAVTSMRTRKMILDVQTSKPVSPMPDSMQAVTAIAVSPDGQELLAGNSVGELFRWDLQQGKLLLHRDRTAATDFVGRGPIYHLSYFDSGKMVLESGNADTRTCDSKTLATKRRLSQPINGVMTGSPAIILSPDARWTVGGNQAGGGMNLELTDRKTSTTTTVLHLNNQFDINSQFRPSAISPDGTLLYGSSSDGPRFVDLVSHQLGPAIQVDSARAHVGQVSSSVRFSPDGRWVVIQMGMKFGLYESRKLTQMPDGTPANAPTKATEGLVAVNGRPVQRIPISDLPPIWTRDTLSLNGGDVDFSSSSELVATMSTAADTHLDINVLETRSGKPLLNLPATLPRTIAIRFVPGKLQMVTADEAGTVLLWDLRTLLLAGNDLSTEKDKTEDELWTLLSDPDPIPAYRAGLVLLDRHQLADRAAALKPLPSSDVRGDTTDIHQLIQSLSSPVPADREKAHKALEAAGSAAIGEVRTALNSHPGGELEDRLKDIAHVIGADDPTIPTPTIAPSTAPVADVDTLRTARVIQLLEWSDDPKAAVQHARLTATGAAR